MLDFSDIISPISVDEFNCRYWEREFLFVQRNDSVLFKDILTLEDLDEFLTRSDLRYPALRVIQEGKQIPLSAYTTSFTMGDYSSNELIQSDRVLDLYRRGATILVQLAHLSLPTLRPLAARLEQFWGFNVEMNVYLTPAGCQGFAPHYDTHSVCVLQLVGEKAWSIYSQRESLPLLDESFNQASDKSGEITGSVMLQPGSFLYVPRGLFHSAKACQTPSLHLTIGLFPPTWIDIFQEHLMFLSNSDAFRSAPKELKPTELSNRLDTFVETFDWERARSDLARKLYTCESQPADGRLLDLLELDCVSETTKIKLRDGINIQVAYESENVKLRCFSAELLLPKATEEAIRFILLQSSSFVPRDISCGLDLSGVLVLCKRLIQEGLLVLAREE